MTNKPNSNQPESNCIPCQSYEYFLTLAKTTDIEEAFHDAMDFVIESLIEDVVDVIGQKSYEDGHSDGFDIGFASAYKSIAEEMTHTAEVLNEELNSPCDDCDCVEGYCEVEDDGTDYKFTFKTDTETVEDKIRNAIRKD